MGVKPKDNWGGGGGYSRIMGVELSDNEGVRAE